MRGITGVLIGYALAIAAFAIWGGFRGYDREPLLVLGTFGVTLVLAVAAQVIGVGKSSSVAATRALLAFVVVTPMVLLAWKLGFSSLFDGATRWWPSKPGFRCLRLSTIVGIAALVPAIVSRVGTPAIRPVATGAAFGTAAGAVAWTLVDLWCPVGHPEHVLLGHVLPTLLLALVGALAGRFLFRPSSSSADSSAESSAESSVEARP